MKLNKGEIICPICNGTRHIIRKNKKSKVIFICRICGGDGKIDWLQNIQRIPIKIQTLYYIFNRSNKEIGIKEFNYIIKPGRNKFPVNIPMGSFLSFLNISERYSNLFYDNELDIIEEIQK